MSVQDRVTLEILRPAAGGECIAHHDGRTVFVSGAIPGETVKAAITSESRRVVRAETVEVLDASPFRVDDRRIAMGVPGAGGLEFAHVDLAHSRSLKETAAVDQLTRIGGIDVDSAGFHVAPAPSDADRGDGAGTRWRTRVQCAVDTSGRLGMLARSSHTVVPFDAGIIPLAVDELNGLGLTDLVMPGVTRVELAAGDQSGAVVLRGPAASSWADQLAQRSREWAGDWSILVETRPDGSGASQSEAGRPRRRSHSGKSRPRAGGAGTGSQGQPRRGARNRGGTAAHPLVVVSGDGMVTERVPGIARELRVRGQGFWQVHRDAAAVLTQSVRQAVGAAGDGLVLDLYCGAGLLGIGLAEDGHRVVGIEGSSEAVADARANAQGVDARFDVGRVEDAAMVANARAAVLDPPRTGAGPAVVDSLLTSSVERIVHVSCDGATLARDLKGLVAGGFSVSSIAAHDLFPVTGHLEFVAVLDR